MPPRQRGEEGEACVDVPEATSYAHLPMVKFDRPRRQIARDHAADQLDISNGKARVGREPLMSAFVPGAVTGRFIVARNRRGAAARHGGIQTKCFRTRHEITQPEKAATAKDVEHQMKHEAMVRSA